MHILNCIANNGWKGYFENQLFVTLAVSMVRDKPLLSFASSLSNEKTNTNMGKP